MDEAFGNKEYDLFLVCDGDVTEGGRVGSGNAGACAIVIAARGLGSSDLRLVRDPPSFLSPAWRDCCKVETLPELVLRSLADSMSSCIP